MTVDIVKLSRILRICIDQQLLLLAPLSSKNTDLRKWVLALDLHAAVGETLSVLIEILRLLDPDCQIGSHRIAPEGLRAWDAMQNTSPN